MRNNIIIAGVPRAGKSSLAHMLSRRFGYQHVSMDAINAGLERAFPQLGIQTSEADRSSLENLSHISAQITPFIRAMLDSGEYDEFEPGMVLDVFQLLPQDYVKYLGDANCEIFYLVDAEMSAEARYVLLKEHDTPKDYSFYKTDEALRNMCASLVEESRLIREQCVRYGLPFYETTANRTLVLETFLQSLAQRR